MVDDVAELVKEARRFVEHRDAQDIPAFGARFPHTSLIARLADALEALAPESGGAVGEDIRYITAALSWYDGTKASADVLEAWTRLRAALAQPAGRSGGEWRDIADAPKDGTPILLGAPAQAYQGKPVAPRSTEGYWYIPEHGKYLGDCGGECRCPEYGDPEPPGWMSMDGGFTEENPPTHFMPLPAPPTGEPG